MSSCAAAQLVGGDGEHLGELLARRAAAVQRGELLARLVDVALPAAERARGPVLAAELVEHGAVDAGPGELLERGALLRVVAVDRGDQRLEAAGDEVLDLAAGRELADLLEDDVLDQRRVGHDQAVARLDVTGAPCRPARARGRPPRRSSSWLLLGGGGLHEGGELLGIGTAAVDVVRIGLGSRPQHHRFGVIASPFELVGPGEHLGDGQPQLLRAPPGPSAERRRAPAARLRVLAHRHARGLRRGEDPLGDVALAAGDDLRRARRPRSAARSRGGGRALRHRRRTGRGAAATRTCAARPGPLGERGLAAARPPPGPARAVAPGGAVDAGAHASRARGRCAGRAGRARPSRRRARRSRRRRRRGRGAAARRRSARGGRRSAGGGDAARRPPGGRAAASPARA